MFHFRGNKDTTDVTFWSNFESKSTKKKFYELSWFATPIFYLIFLWLNICVSKDDNIVRLWSVSKQIIVEIIQLTTQGDKGHFWCAGTFFSTIILNISLFEPDKTGFQGVSGDYENLRNLRSCQKIYKRQIGVNGSQLKLFSGDSRVMKLLKWVIRRYWGHFLTDFRDKNLGVHKRTLDLN